MDGTLRSAFFRINTHFGANCASGKFLLGSNLQLVWFWGWGQTEKVVLIKKMPLCTEVI